MISIWAAALCLMMTGLPARAQSLADALDYPLLWTTYGDLQWFGQTNITRDGVDAATCFQPPPPFPASRYGVLETTITAPGEVSFYCKAAVNFGVSGFVVYQGGTPVFSMDRTQDWTRVSLFALPGQNLTFFYHEFGWGPPTSNTQRVWVDQVNFVPWLPPFILAQPAGGDYTAGATVTLSIDAFRVESYQWYLSGTNAVAGGTNATLLLPSLQPAQAGNYTVVLSNASSVLTSAVARVTHDLLPVALDDELIWNCGTTPWHYETVGTHDGVDAARTTSGGQLDTTVTGPGAVSFWWRVATPANWRYFSFRIDGGTLENLTGETDWEYRTYLVPEGEHTLTWAYTESIPGGSGPDAAWLDDVQYSKAPKILAQPQGATFIEGAQTEFAFSVTVLGAPPIFYQWFRNGFPLAGQTNSGLALSNLLASQSGNYTVVVSNDFGAITSAVARLTVFTFPLLLETTNLTWSTHGHAPWIGTQDTTHDGADAAMSAELPYYPDDFRYSILEATSATAGWLSFWWKVSSRTNQDVLVLQIGDAEKACISGEVGWQQRTVPVPKDALMRWGYYRTDGTPGGQNLAWLDEVTFTPVFAPVITRPPQDTHLLLDGSGGLTVEYIGEPATVHWFFNGTNLLADGTNTTLLFSNATPALSGIYFAVLSNAFGVLTSAVVTLDVYWLGDSLDTTNLAWTTTGYAKWFNQTNVTHDGVDAAASGDIGDTENTPGEFEFQYSILEARVNGPGTVGFWWKVSSEQGFDPLQFTVWDLATGVESVLAQISGETGWQQKSFFIPEGEHALWWIYRKDASVTQGADRGWVDEVTWTRVTGPVITNQPLNRVAGFGDTATFAVGAFSAEPLTYQWFFNGTLPLLDETNAELFVTGVTPAQEGDYSVVVSTAFGAVTSAVAQLRLMTLAEALDNDTLVWTNTFTTNAEPAARWIPQTVSVYDGVDAVQLGPFTNTPTSFLETSVTGPGLLSFFWAASSPAEGITFWIGTNLIEQRIETGGWEYREFEISAGLHALRWGYSNYQDTVEWEAYGVVLDQVVFQQAGLPPVFTLQPQDAHARPFIDANGFTADGTGYPPPTRQWFFNGQPLPGQTNVTLSINPVGLTNAGAYHMVLSNPNGSVTSAVARLVLHKQHLEMAQILGCVQAGHEEVDVQVVGDRAYVAELYYGLRIFDVSNPASPVLIGSQPTAGYARGVTVSNGLAYVAASGAGVQIFDVTEAASIFQIGGHFSKGEATATALAGSRLYVADGPGGLAVLDLSQPMNVTRLGIFRPPGSVVKVRVMGNIAYLASSGSGLYAVDCTDPAQPVLLGFFAQPGAADLQIVGDVLYLASCGSGPLRLDTFRIGASGALSALGRWVHYAGAPLPPRLQVARGVAFLGVWAPNEEFAGFITLDVFDPARPVWTSEFGTGSYANGFQIVGDRIFIANGGAGFCVYRINEFPAAPPRLSNVISQDGVFRATLTNVPDHFPVVIECSADLQTWTPVQTNSFFGPALEIFLDAGPNSAMKFFRIRTH